MKQIFTNYRYYVLVVFALFAVIGILAVPAENLPGFTWVYCLVSSKILGLLSCWIFHALYKRWERYGTIPELVNLINNF